MVNFKCIQFIPLILITFLFIETVWEPPKEGYLSIQEQKTLEDNAYKMQIKQYESKMAVNSRLMYINYEYNVNNKLLTVFFFRKQEEAKEEAEKRAAAAREKLKERRVEDIAPVVAAPIIPAGKTEPYGQWKTVTTRYILTFKELAKNIYHACL